MRTYLDCIPCFMGQALRICRMAGCDEADIKGAMDEISVFLRDFPLDRTPPEAGMHVHRILKRHTGQEDPYRDIKRKSTEKALSIYPRLVKTVETSPDPLLTAVRLAIASNVIDHGTAKAYDIDREVAEALDTEPAIFDGEALRARVDGADRILYIGDNAGETVFDRLLIEQIGKPAVFVVRGVPVINDATREDALQAGLEKVADIVSSGTEAPGTVLGTCSREFLDLFYGSPLIISKGQGNYEALSEQQDRPMFFLLKAKCNVIAGHLGVNVGDMVLKGTDAAKDRTRD